MPRRTPIRKKKEDLMRRDKEIKIKWAVQTRIKNDLKTHLLMSLKNSPGIDLQLNGRKCK